MLHLWEHLLRSHASAGGKSEPLLVAVLGRVGWRNIIFRSWCSSVWRDARRILCRQGWTTGEPSTCAKVWSCVATTVEGWCTLVFPHHPLSTSPSPTGVKATHSASPDILLHRSDSLVCSHTGPPHISPDNRLPKTDSLACRLARSLRSSGQPAAQDGLPRSTTGPLSTSSPTDYPDTQMPVCTIPSPLLLHSSTLLHKLKVLQWSSLVS
jgi:hypothetical protein